MEQEGGRARQLGGTVIELVLQDGQAVAQCLAEALLLLAEHAHDEVALAGDVRIGGTHHVDRHLGEPGHDELFGAEQIGVAHGSPDDPAQHEAAGLVAREHAVADEHRGRASVFGEHPHGEAVPIVVVAGSVRATGGAAGLLDERCQEIGLPDGVDALQQAEDPLEPGPGVDRGAGQRRAGAIRRLVVLHEDQVPELHVAVTVRVLQRPALGTEVRTAVEVQLGARTTRARLPHLPEVVLVAEALDALHRHADDVVPDLLGLVVTGVDGDPDAVAVEPPVLGDELPAVGDRQLLEVVPEAEVAHHLEEHEMALGPADVVEVVVLATGTDALLRADGPAERRHLVADEIRLERHHAGDVEQDCRVVWDETRRWHRRVLATREEVEEGLAELVRVTRRLSAHLRR